MSTFKKYLQLISESDGYSNAIDTHKEIAKLNNSKEIVYSSHSTFKKVELDDEAKEFIKNIVDDYERTIKNNPKLKEFGTISKFTLPTLNQKMSDLYGKFISPKGNPRQLGKKIKTLNDANNFKDTLIHELIDKLNKMLESKNFSQYFGTGDIKIINDEISNNGNSNSQNYPWFAIDIDVKNMKQRPWSAPEYSVEKSYPNVHSSQDTQKFIDTENRRRQDEITIDGKKAKEKSEKIKKQKKKEYFGPRKKNKK